MKSKQQCEIATGPDGLVLSSIRKKVGFFTVSNTVW
jgi:hypothetical protein